MNKTKEGLSSAHYVLRDILKFSDKALKAWEIGVQYLKITGKRMSESSITARLREMRDVSCCLSTYTYTME